MSYQWYGIGFLILIIVVVVIIVVIVNKGNTLNIIDQLPNYKIYYPAQNKYWGITNINPNIFSSAIQYEYSATNDVFWLPIATVSENADLFIWKLQILTPSSFDTVTSNTKMVKIINSTLVDQNPNFGFLQQTAPGPIAPVLFLANSPSTSSTTFIYTSTGLNTFTLSIGNGHVSVNNQGHLTLTTQGSPSEFKLVPTF
jgi:hypothetical protein